MIFTPLHVNMAHDDLHVIEKRWRRKRLFRQSRQSLVPYLAVILLILSILVFVVGNWGWVISLNHSDGAVIWSITAAFRNDAGVRYLITSILLLLCLSTAVTTQAQTPAPSISSDSDVATAGFYHLSWDAAFARIELQEATTPDFRSPTTLYKGTDSATTISGKPDGQWYYRVRVLQDEFPGPWSDPVEVTVAHHSLSRALMFLTLGIVVFISIVTVIIRGARQETWIHRNCTSIPSAYVKI